jgi:hypothetical protein
MNLLNEVKWIIPHSHAELLFVFPLRLDLFRFAAAFELYILLHQL